MIFAQQPPYIAQVANLNDGQNLSLDEIETLLLQNEKVYAVRSFEFEGNFVFALLSYPIFTKSERDLLKSTLLQIIKRATTNQVTITFDNQVFRQIDGNLTDEQKRKLLSLARSRI